MLETLWPHPATCQLDTIQRLDSQLQSKEAPATIGAAEQNSKRTKVMKDINIRVNQLKTDTDRHQVLP